MKLQGQRKASHNRDKSKRTADLPLSLRKASGFPERFTEIVAAAPLRHSLK
jgi:hypothetical protein